MGSIFWSIELIRMNALSYAAGSISFSKCITNSFIINSSIHVMNVHVVEVVLLVIGQCVARNMAFLLEVKQAGGKCVHQLRYHTC